MWENREKNEQKGKQIPMGEPITMGSSLSLECWRPRKDKGGKAPKGKSLVPRWGVISSNILDLQVIVFSITDKHKTFLYILENATFTNDFSTAFYSVTVLLLVV